MTSTESIKRDVKISHNTRKYLRHEMNHRCHHLCSNIFVIGLFGTRFTYAAPICNLNGILISDEELVSCKFNFYFVFAKCPINYSMMEREICWNIEMLCPHSHPEPARSDFFYFPISNSFAQFSRPVETRKKPAGKRRQRNDNNCFELISASGQFTAANRPSRARTSLNANFHHNCDILLSFIRRYESPCREENAGKRKHIKILNWPFKMLCCRCCWVSTPLSVSLTRF
jgi:hypothetical protein